MVARTRDWEQGLVVVYQTYLRALEAELKGTVHLSLLARCSTLLPARSELADISLSAMCTLVTELTHFNFRVNLMSCIVARLSKKSWDKVCPSRLSYHFSELPPGVRPMSRGDHQGLPRRSHRDCIPRSRTSTKPDGEREAVQHPPDCAVVLAASTAED